MAEPNGYPHERLYGAFVHRELTVAWICQALLIGGQHRLDLGTGTSPDGSAASAPGFHCLEFGCGQGFNLIFNAAAHPEGRFYGVDLNPSHVAAANAMAADLGLANVVFALADLCDFAAGRPERGPVAAWPELFDLVLAHGVAAWVSPEVRQALVAAAAALLRPGGVFQCSYNTYPGWLARSPLAMLSQEQALRAGGVASGSLIRSAARRLQAFLGSATEPLPLGIALPDLATALEEMPSAAGDSYLEGEFHAAHQPLYVGPMHRLCAAHGLSAVGSATLPELFPEMLDPIRRELVEQAEDPALRQVLLDLAINQTFRRDLFARGVCTPAPAWRRQALSEMQLVLRSGTWPEDGGFDTPLGRMGIDLGFCEALRQTLATTPLTLGELAARAGEPLEDLLPRLAVLLHSGRVSLAGIPGRPESDLASNQAAAAAFNERALARITAGAPLDWLISPLLLQPLPITLVQAFFLPLLDQGMAVEEAVQLVWMGIALIGGTFRNREGRLLDDPAEVIDQLVADWGTFQRDQLPEWRRLGLVGESIVG